MSSAVVVGASAGVGRALATELASRGTSLVIVSRAAEDIEATASDLRIRFGVQCIAVVQDISDSEWDVGSFATECACHLGRIDAVFVPAGAVDDSDMGANAEVINSVARTNFIGPARIAAEFGSRMACEGAGTVVLFSSIAAAAPRQKNAAYSASKAALEVYAKALRFALEPHGVLVRVIALGYVDTSLAFGLPLRFPVATAEGAAAFVLARRRTAGRWYYPRFWLPITLILRHLPWFIYRRLSF